MANWGELAESMEAFVEVSLIDELSGWRIYLIALNPDDQDTLLTLVSGDIEVMQTYSLYSLLNAFNSDGEGLTVDTEFRRVKACVLYKKLKGY